MSLQNHKETKRKILSKQLARFQPKEKLHAIGTASILVLVILMTTSVLKLNGIVDWVTNSDQATLPTFANDLLKNPGAYWGWQQQRSPLLFPDLFSYVFVKGVFGLSSIMSIALSAAPTLFGFVYLGLNLTPWKKKDNLLTSYLVTILFLLIIPFLLCLQFSDLTFWLMKFYFTFANHFSAAVAAILIAYWLYSNNFNSKTKSLLAGTAILMFSFSDLIFTLWFIPILTLYFIVNYCAIASTQNRNVLTRFMSILVLIILGNLLRQSLNVAYFQPISFSPLDIINNLKKELIDVFNIFLSSQILVVIFGLILMNYFFLLVRVVQQIKVTKWRSFEESSSIFRTFGFSVSFSAFLSFFISGVGWESEGSIRYLVFFFFAPLLFVPSTILNLLTKWQSHKSLIKVTTIVLTTAGVILSIFSATPSSALESYSSYAKSKTLPLQDCIREGGGTKGLAGYWTARQLNFLSDGFIRLGQLAPYETQPNTLLFYWANNILDYYDSNNPNDNFDYVIMDNLSEATVKAAFGPSTSQLICSGHSIWFYEGNFDITSNLVRNNSVILSTNLRIYKTLKIPAVFFSSQKPKYLDSKLVASGSLGSTVPILYGQYLPIEQGPIEFYIEYTITPSMKSQPLGHLYFDLATNTGQTILFTKELPLTFGSRVEKIQVDTRGFPSLGGIEPRLLLADSGLTIEILSIEIQQR